MSSYSLIRLKQRNGWVLVTKKSGRWAIEIGTVPSLRSVSTTTSLFRAELGKLVIETAGGEVAILKLDLHALTKRYSRPSVITALAELFTVSGAIPLRAKSSR